MNTNSGLDARLVDQTRSTPSGSQSCSSVSGGEDRALYLCVVVCLSMGLNMNVYCIRTSRERVPCNDSTNSHR